MNAKPNPGKWLIISYAMNMEASAASQHIDDKIEPLSDHGIEPLLLSSVCGARTANQIHETTFSLSPAGLRVELRHFLRRHIGNRRLQHIILILLFFPLFPFYLLEKAMLRRESEWSWRLLAQRRGLAMVKKYQPDLIFSTGGPVCAHLAASYIAKKTGLPWIADLQDPLVHDKDKRHGARDTAYYTKLEKHIRDDADATIFTTDAHRINSNRRAGNDAKGHTVYPGANPNVLPEVSYVPGKFCRFGHFGSMGGKRNVAVFLPAIETVIQRRPEYRDIIRLELYGNCDGKSKDLVAANRFSQIVTFHGKVTRQDALEAMMKTDVLLVIHNTEHISTETFPSKVYDYFLTGRPILALIHNNPEFEQLLGSSGNFIAPADDIEKVADAIEKIVTEHLAGKFANWQPCDRWTSACAVDRICEIASRIA